MNDGDMSAIIDEFVDAILGQEEAIYSDGGVGEVRKYARKIERLENRLLRSREGVEQLSTLLDHRSVLIRANVATMLLGTLKHDEAMEVLRELNARNDVFGWAAGKRIKEWETQPERYTSGLTDESRKPDIP